MKLHLNLHTHMILQAVCVCLQNIEKKKFKIYLLKETDLSIHRSEFNYREISKNLKNYVNMSLQIVIKIIQKKTH